MSLSQVWYNYYISLTLTPLFNFCYPPLPLLVDVTGGYAQLNIQGPTSRLLMQKLTDCDMSNESFPFRTCKEIAIGLARVKVARITYVGELG